MMTLISRFILFPLLTIPMIALFIGAVGWTLWQWMWLSLTTTYNQC